MASPPTRDLTQLLVAWCGGEQSALDRLVPLACAGLHRRGRPPARRGSVTTPARRNEVERPCRRAPVREPHARAGIPDDACGDDRDLRGEAGVLLTA